MKDIEAKMQERLPEASKIIHALKETISNIHSLCGESDAVLFRQDLAKLIAHWAYRLNYTQTDYSKDGLLTKGDSHMTDKERIMQKYEEWGLDTRPINANIAIDCYSAIQGLEEAIHNLQAIAFAPSTEIDTAKRALMKELAVISANAATMLNRYLPEISQEADSADSDEMPF